MNGWGDEGEIDTGPSNWDIHQQDLQASIEPYKDNKED